MNTLNRPPTPIAATLIAALGLASAMGIGRFAFTPLLPLMQQSFGLTLRQGAWLASANYIGYLLGALVSLIFNPAPGRAARLSLLWIAVLTIATGLTHMFEAWVVLRLLTGVASAYALIGISSWVLNVLSQQPSTFYGWVFAGVGLGMILAGFTGLAAGVWHQSPDHAWLAMGVFAVAVLVLAWRPLNWGAGAPRAVAAHTAQRMGVEGWKITFCYGAFGFGYIIPATFLPAFARQLISDPSVFGWVWPVFGAAAALSTIISAYLFKQALPRNVWAYSLVVTAVGVLAPALYPCLATVVISTFCVGGTFMVVTMAGLREARLVAGADASRLIAAMTTAFAVGQLLGPLTIPPGTLQESIFYPSVGAACLLLAAAITLLRRRSTT
ncbi:YbfB/YjiJ family MFS transporter [Paralcaligenes sp. KSB-10]|uniref:YbfB/YjiJ family MFS transporter n=1 Tax=Paralcaligenes sp. KSB-10 TaxID=2901142 RepID=UPI001E3C6FA3|nr:YbfB/YjiJ family MFS transporter [Paralcaligenes sp. KSB-10]UHL64312.1 YbfB/YjiJ family MFS transporter [Paralcaligenes sp. KSB-10]